MALSLTFTASFRHCSTIYQQNYLLLNALPTVLPVKERNCRTATALRLTGGVQSLQFYGWIYLRWFATNPPGD